MSYATAIAQTARTAICYRCSTETRSRVRLPRRPTISISSASCLRMQNVTMSISTASPVSTCAARSGASPLRSITASVPLRSFPTGTGSGRYLSSTQPDAAGSRFWRRSWRAGSACLPTGLWNPRAFHRCRSAISRSRSAGNGASSTAAR